MKGLPVFWGLVFLYLFVFQIQAVWPFTIDDMYITLRYAQHWADGHGLLWNLMEAPVEGYSNFSFVVLGVSALKLGLNPVIVLKMTGVLGLLLTAWALYGLSRFFCPPKFALIPPAWLLAYKGEVIWSVGGLETTVYQALLCFSVWLTLKGLATKKTGFLMMAAVCLSLAGLTRPEAPAFMLLMIGLIAFQKNRVSKTQGLLFFMVLFGLYGTYFLWRWHYFGYLFPNSVSCKVLAKGHYLTLDSAYLQLIAPFGLLALVSLLNNPKRWHAFFYAPSVLYLLLLIGADPIVAFSNRLFLPAFALLLPLAFNGLCVLIEKWVKPRDWVYDLAVYVGSFWVLVFFIPSMSLKQYEQFTQNPLAGEQIRREVVNWIDNHAKENAHIVLGDCGLIPFLSHKNFIDSFCLNNLKMTQNKSKDRDRDFCETILFQRPEVIILTSLTESGHVIYAPVDLCLKKTLMKHPTYQFQTQFSTSNPESRYTYEIYTIKG